MRWSTKGAESMQMRMLCPECRISSVAGTSMIARFMVDLSRRVILFGFIVLQSHEVSQRSYTGLGVDPIEWCPNYQRKRIESRKWQPADNVLW